MSRATFGAKRRAIPSERSRKATRRQRLHGDLLRGDQPASPRPAEPADRGMEQVSWITVAFPAAAAREEQIRQGARVVDMVKKTMSACAVASRNRPHALCDPAAQPRDACRSQGITAENGRGYSIPAAEHQRAAAKPAVERARDLPDKEHAKLATTNTPQKPAIRSAYESGLRTFGPYSIPDELGGVEIEREPGKLLNPAFFEVVDRDGALDDTEWEQERGFGRRILVERAHRSAAELRATLQADGPLACAAKLRKLTDAEATEPFTAAQIFSQSEKSVAAMASHLTTCMRRVRSDNRYPLAEGLPASAASLSYAQRRQLFADINAAADSASRSQTGLAVANRTACLLRDAPIDLLVTTSIGDGDGIVLPLDIVRQRLEGGSYRAANELAIFIQVGLGELRNKTRGAVIELGAMASFVMTLGAGEIVDESRQAYAEKVADVTAQSLLIRYSFALTRAIKSLAQAEPWLGQLANYERLRRLGKVPDETASPR
jgi:hypothetical protein